MRSILDISLTPITLCLNLNQSSPSIRNSTHIHRNWKNSRTTSLVLCWVGDAPLGHCRAGRQGRAGVACFFCCMLKLRGQSCKTSNNFVEYLVDTQVST
jgi:hypothetical protein